MFPDVRLFSISAHGLLPNGEVRAEPDAQGAVGLWYFLFVDEGKARAVVYAPGAHGRGSWTVLHTPDVPAEILRGNALELKGVADSGVLAQYFCGFAGYDALNGSPLHSLMIHMRGSRAVAIVEGEGGLHAALDALNPAEVLDMNFEPVRIDGEVV